MSLQNQNQLFINGDKNKKAPCEQLEIVKSITYPDPQWDDFLNCIPGAEFEQSSLWAVIKKEQGWEPVRYIFRYGDKIIGGYQILVKRKKIPGTFGYAVKGPTYLPEYKHFATDIVEHLLKTTRLLKCHFLLIQPPFISNELETYLEKRHFTHEKLLKMIEVSVVIDLRNKNPGELLAGLKSKRRQNIKKAEKSALRFLEGNATDLECFFELMKDSCRRRSVSPNPGSLVNLRKVWETFSSKDMIKLFFIEMNDEKICGIITILFGRTVYLWKFGWSGKMAGFHPNEYLYWKIIEWSIQNKYDYSDLVGTSKEYLPENYKTCCKIPVKNLKENSELKLSFGGDIVTLPKVRIVFFNRIFHMAYIAISFLGEFFPPLINLLKRKATI